MENVNLPADYRLRLEKIEADIADLQRRNSDAESPAERVEVVFTLAGPLVVSTSPRFYFSPGANLRRIIVSLADPGTSNTVVVAYRNDVEIPGSAITLASGVTFAKVNLDVRFQYDSDYLRFGATQAGAGAADLTCQARCVGVHAWSIRSQA